VRVTQTIGWLVACLLCALAGALLWAAVMDHHGVPADRDS
jgi:hypothetical protein